MVLTEALHQFFFFLGTERGLLARRSVELIFFTIITYMILSEYLRTREREHKYLLFSFSSLAFQKAIISAVLAIAVFGNLVLGPFNTFLPVIDRWLETFALILLTNAFIFPLYPKVGELGLKKYVRLELAALVVAGAIVEFFWYQQLTGNNPNQVFLYHWGDSVFVLFNIILLAVPLYFWIFRAEGERYRKNIILAFALYIITPLLQLANTIFFNELNTKLIVAEYPFPFLSMLLFTQVVYLKLVDKVALQEKLKQSEQRYLYEREVSKMKDEFVSVVSHELRTPLTSIKLYLSLLKNKALGTLTKKQEEAIETIKNESDRLAKLINDILDLSRLESGKVKLNLERTELSSITDDRIYYKLAEKKGISIVNNVPNSFEVMVDRDKFKQVFVNLISNAIKYTEPRGTIMIGASRNEKTWEFVMRDTGKGIEKDKIPRLFDKFYQIEDYMTRSQKGSGLGLAIVKNIVDLHKGKITVESAPGMGSTFRIIIPNEV